MNTIALISKNTGFCAEIQSMIKKWIPGSIVIITESIADIGNPEKPDKPKLYIIDNPDNFPDILKYLTDQQKYFESTDTSFILIADSDYSAYPGLNQAIADAILLKPVKEIEIISIIQSKLKASRKIVDKTPESNQSPTKGNIQSSMVGLPELITLINDLNSFVYRCRNDKNWTMVFLSDAVQKISGYPATDFINNAVRSYNSILHPDDQERVWKEIQEALKKNTHFIVEYRIISAAGKIKWIWEKGRCLKVDKEILFIDGIIEDVTNLKQITIALKENEEKYKTLIEIAPDAIFIYKNKKIMYLNPAAIGFFGAKSEKELIGRPLLEFVHADYSDIITNRIDALYKTGKAVPPFKLKMKQLNGKEIIAESTAIFFELNGEPAIQVIMNDITEKEKLESELKEQNEIYKMILDNSIDAILLTSVDGKILVANTAACKMFGMSEQELTGSVRDDVIDKTDERINLLLEERKKNGFAKGEITLIRKDKSKFPAEITSSVFIDRYGIRKTSMIIRDITERKLFENNLYNLKNNLQQEVERKTKELNVRIAELERFHEATINREFRIKELNEEIKRLKQKT